MADELDVKLVISAQQKAKGIIDDLTRSLGGMSGGFSAAGVAGVAAGAAIAGVAAAAAGAAMVIGTSVKKAAEFQVVMSNVGTVISGDSTEAVAGFSDEILKMTRTIPKSADELGTGLYDILSAGVSDSAQAMKVLESSAKLGTAGLGTTAEATDIMTSAINAFGLDASQSNKIADTLFKTVNFGKVNVAQMAQAFGSTAPIIAAAGITLEEFSAATAALTTTGQPASQAQNGLRQAVVSLTKPTEDMSKLFKQLGFESGDAAIKQFGLVEVMKKVDEAANGNTETLGRAYGSVEAMGSAISLTGPVADSFASTLAAMEGGVDSLEEAFKKQTETFTAQKQLLTNLMNEGFIRLGSVILPYVTTAVENLKNMIMTGVSQWKNYEGVLGTIRKTFDSVWNTIQQAIQQWQNYEGAIGEARKVAETLVAFFKDQFIKAWEDLRKAIEPYIPQLKILAKIIAVVVVVALVALVVSITSVILIAVKLIGWILKAGTAFENFKKNAIDYVNNALNNFGTTLSNVAGWIVDMSSNAMLATNDFVNSIGATLGGLVESTVEWGQHMIDNFVTGIKNGIAGLGESLGNVADTIKHAIGFSKNPNIPSEVWGLHMMQNFAGGIDEGNSEVVQALNDAVAKAKERISAFTETFTALKAKVRDAWSDFKDATNDAKKTYGDVVKDIKKKNKELKASFAEDFAGAVIGIQDRIASLKVDLSVSNVSFDQQMAEKFVDAEGIIADSKAWLDAEMAKSDADRDSKRIEELQANIAKQQSFLEKHADTINQIEGIVSEERRVRGLDDIELLKEQKAAEAAVLQEQIDKEQEILNAHSATIQRYNDSIVEQRRVRGLDELSIMLENFDIEKNALILQQEEALKIKNDALLRAKKQLQGHLQDIAADTKKTVKEMAREFDKIPASMGDALEKLSNRLINAGSKISGNSVTNNNNNNKNVSITVNASGGEGQADLLSRLGVLLKTI